MNTIIRITSIWALHITWSYLILKLTTFSILITFVSTWSFWKCRDSFDYWSSIYFTWFSIFQNTSLLDFTKSMHWCLCHILIHHIFAWCILWWGFLLRFCNNLKIINKSKEFFFSFSNILCLDDLTCTINLKSDVIFIVLLIRISHSTKYDRIGHSTLVILLGFDEIYLIIK